MQLLTILTSGNWSVLDRDAFDSENISWALDLTADATYDTMASFETIWLPVHDYLLID